MSSTTSVTVLCARAPPGIQYELNRQHVFIKLMANPAFLGKFLFIYLFLQVSVQAPEPF